MSYAEEVVKLRKIMLEAVGSGLISMDSKDTVEAILIQIMNEAEKHRQQCVAQAENFRKQAATLDGQAAAFSSQTSFAYHVLNGYIKIAERAKEEEMKQASELAEKEGAIRLEKQAVEEKTASEVDGNAKVSDSSTVASKSRAKKK